MQDKERDSPHMKEDFDPGDWGSGPWSLGQTESKHCKQSKHVLT